VLAAIVVPLVGIATILSSAITIKKGLLEIEKLRDEKAARIQKDMNELVAELKELRREVSEPQQTLIDGTLAKIEQKTTEEKAVDPGVEILARRTGRATRHLLGIVKAMIAFYAFIFAAATLVTAIQRIW
jgi:hypothetical protein